MFILYQGYSLFDIELMPHFTSIIKHIEWFEQLHLIPNLNMRVGQSHLEGFLGCPVTAANNTVGS